MKYILRTVLNIFVLLSFLLNMTGGAAYAHSTNTRLSNFTRAGDASTQSPRERAAVPASGEIPQVAKFTNTGTRLYLPVITTSSPPITRFVAEPGVLTTATLDGVLDVTIPAGASDVPLQIEYLPASAPPANALASFALTASSGGAQIEQLKMPAGLRLHYTTASGLDEAHLGLYRLDETTGRWLSLSTQIDAEINTASTATPKLGSFALLSDEITDCRDLATIALEYGLPHNVINAFVRGCQRVGLENIGQPDPATPPQLWWEDTPVWFWYFTKGSFFHNASVNEAYWLALEVESAYKWKAGFGPRGFLGLPIMDTLPASGPVEFRDELHDFGGMTYQQFEHGFIAQNKLSNNEYEAHRFFPNIARVSIKGSKYEIGKDDNDQPIYRARVDLSTEFDIAPGAGENDSPATEFILTGETSAGGFGAGGPVTSNTETFSLENLDLDETIQWNWKLVRAAYSDDLIGYAPCRSYENNAVYGPVSVLSNWTREVGCFPGGGIPVPVDSTPPQIYIVEVYSNGQGSISIKALITDNSGVISHAELAAGSPAVVGIPLYPTPEFGENIWSAVLTSVPDNIVIPFTITASDPSGNTAEKSGNTRDRYTLQQGLGCLFDNCGNGTVMPWLDPILPSNGSYYQPLPTITLPGPGNSDIEIPLIYYTTNVKTGPVGQQWVFPYGMSLRPINNLLLAGVEINYPDGSIVAFAKQGDVYKPLTPGVYDTLVEQGDGYILTLKRSLESFEFDLNGQLTVQKDRNGNAIRFTYADGRLIRVENDAQRAVDLTYNADGRITNMAGSGGKNYRFTYSGPVLETFTDANGKVWSFHYEERPMGTLLAFDGQPYEAVDYYLTGITTPKGHNKNQQSFDEKGRVIDQTVGGREHNTVSYDEAQRETTFTDPYGNKTIHRFDEKWRLIELVRADGKSEVFGYDEKNNRVFYRNPAGHEYFYKYDDRGNRLTESGPDGLYGTWEYNDLNLVTRMTEKVSIDAVRETAMAYDARGNLVMITNARGDQSTIEYDSRGLPTKTTDFAGHQTINTYNASGDLVLVTNGEGSQTSYTYDAAGRRATMTLPLGQVFTYTYDPADHLTAVDGPIGYHMGYTFDENGNQQTITDPNGGVTTYTHDSTERVTSITDPAGNLTTYTYGEMSELTSVTDAEGHLITYGYDALLRMTDIYEPLDKHTHMDYDAAGSITDVTDAEGHVRHTVYDALGRPLTVTENYIDGAELTADTNVTTAYTYNIAGDLLKLTDPEGNTTEYTYDVLGLLKSKRTAENQEWFYDYDKMGNLLAVKNPRGFTTAFEYNRIYQLIRVTDAAGSITEYLYDKNGNQTSEIDPLRIVTQRFYDPLDRLESEVRNYRPGLVPDAQTNVTMRYEYDLAGNLRFITDPRGYRAEQVYDAAMRLTDRYDFENARTSYKLDRMGNILSITDDNDHAIHYTIDALNRQVAITNAEGDMVRFDYNKLGQLRQVIDARGYVTSFTLDALGRVTRQMDALNGEWLYAYNRVGSLLSTTDANGNSRSSVYDRVYRAIEQVDSEGFITSFTWDANDNLTGHVDANNHPTVFKYNELDRLVELVNAEDEPQHYGYDPLGNQTSLIEGDGTLTRYSYDLLYRLTSVTENAKDDQPASSDTNVVTHYAFDASSNLVTLTNANGKSTSFTFDGMGRITSEVDPLGNTWKYTWDGAGNQTSRLDANGVLTSYSYYPDDQLRQTVYADGTALHFAYDANNNPQALQDTLGVTLWTVDPLNRVTGVTDSLGRTLSTVYDKVGNRTGLIYPEGNTLSYRFDKNDRMAAMIDPEGRETAYTRDPAGNITTIQYPNSITTSVVYDKVDRVIQRVNQQIGGANETTSAFTYTYNDVGHVTQVSEHYGWRNPADVVETYTYDGLHRLAQVDTNYGLVSKYAYDPTGNRLNWETNDNLATQTPLDGFSTRFEYNDANQLERSITKTAHQNDDQTVTLRYDGNGNRTNQQIESLNGPIYGSDYRYDPENHLVAVQDYQLVDHGNRIDRAITTMSYDGLGRKLVEAYDPKLGPQGIKRTEYTFDGLDPIAEYEILNGQRADYYRGDGSSLVTLQHYPAGTPGQAYWYQFNGKGDVSGLTKQSGQSTHNYRYDAYGSVIPDNGNFTAPHNDYTLTGKEFNGDTGLTYFGARFYDAVMGVWLNQDSYRGEYKTPMSLHRYMYVYGNPVSYYDHYGNKVETDELSIELVNESWQEGGGCTDGFYKICGQYSIGSIGGNCGIDVDDLDDIGAAGSVSSISGTEAEIIGNEYLGFVSELEVYGPKVEALLGYDDDDGFGANVGAKVAGLERRFLFNVANLFSIGLGVGIGVELEIGVKVNKKKGLVINLGPLEGQLVLSAPRSNAYYNGTQKSFRERWDELWGQPNSTINMNGQLLQCREGYPTEIVPGVTPTPPFTPTFTPTQPPTYLPQY
jgi:RHS repeat-associated protein